MTFSNGDQAKWITGECTLGEPIYKVVEIKGTFNAGGKTFTGSRIAALDD